MAINPHVARLEKQIPKKPFDSDPRYVYLTPRQMEQRFGLSRSYWYRRRESQSGPLFAPLGARKILYRLDIVQAWFEEQFVQGFDDPKYKALKEKYRVANKNNRKPLKSEPKHETVSIIRGEVSVVRNPVAPIPAPTSRPRTFRFLAVDKAPRERATASEAARSRIPYPRAV